MMVLPTDRLLIAGKYSNARKVPGGRAVNFHASTGGVNLRNSRKATPDKALLDAVSRGAAKLLPYDDFSAQKPQLLRVDKSGTILRLKLSPGVLAAFKGVS